MCRRLLMLASNKILHVARTSKALSLASMDSTTTRTLRQQTEDAAAATAAAAAALLRSSYFMTSGILGTVMKIYFFTISFLIRVLLSRSTRIVSLTPRTRTSGPRVRTRTLSFKDFSRLEMLKHM